MNIKHFLLIALTSLALVGCDDDHNYDHNYDRSNQDALNHPYLVGNWGTNSLYRVEIETVNRYDYLYFLENKPSTTTVIPGKHKRNITVIYNIDGVMTTNSLEEVK